ncbi:MAG: DNA-directed RNA polymerase subunit beta' [Coriobacteriia bacterium]|nr:DNA-directed RNA polymerase subunit beta' [Coriobacteriia bacterium]
MPDIDVSSFDRLRIKLSSTDEIRSWSSGEVKKAETINYRSQKPEKDGLFCERIFGPTKDWECACGKYRRVRYRGVVCERCGVEVTRAKVRRERMGHIELAAPVSHVWYTQGVAKHMSTLLDLKYKDLEKVLYFVSPIVTSVDFEARERDAVDLREEIEASIEEFARERDRDLEEVERRQNVGLALALADFDDIEIACMISKSTEARSIRSANKATAKSGKAADSAREKLTALMDRLSLAARFPGAAAALEALRAGELEFDDDDAIMADLEPDARAKAIIKEAESDRNDVLEDYEERCEIRNAALEQFMKLQPMQIFDDELVYREMMRLFGPQIAADGTLRDPGYCTGGMGAENVRDLLSALDLPALRTKLRQQLAEVHAAAEDPTVVSASTKKIIKRLSVVDAFVQSDINPAWMVMDAVPVMPPELRPMVQLDGGRFATSDLNDLYRRVINRNNRLRKLLDLGAPDIIVSNEKRMLQEAVDKLFDNRRDDRRQVKGPSGRALKSLSHTLNGKQGRFRQNLLGKRVDYSGRSVIVGGPELKLHQCGLPKYMALELFKPFVMKRLVDRYTESDGRDGAANIKAAKKLVERQRSIVWDVLEEVISDHPVLLNRAPTLHRLGIQAFEPVLVEGKAIQLHPLVCTAFNADFDGDQMAVHIPLSTESQAEARVLMLSTNNIKSPANGRPLATPSQDMVLGIYHLTSAAPEALGEGRVFLNTSEAVFAYDTRAELELQAKVSVRLTRDIEVVDEKDAEPVPFKAGQRIETTVGRVMFNRSLPDDYPFINYALDKSAIAIVIEDLTSRYTTNEISRILDDLKRLGFHYATHAGLTVSLYDAMIPSTKAQILGEYEAMAQEVEDSYDMGELTTEERRREVVNIWNRATDAIGDAMVEEFDQNNPIYLMAASGARGNLKQIRQLAGMRGLMQSPKGDVIDRPIKTNFREGLTVLEYFISTHGARKGLADTALGTETGGYTTRRFLDFVHDAIVRTEDCGTFEGVALPLRAAHKNGDFDDNLVGRVVAEDVVGKGGKVLLAAGEYIVDLDIVAEFDANGHTEVIIRTALTCLEGRGICQKCYGYDLSNGKPVDIGTAVGVIAAQSIGEPGTQLTMRTFHTGGVAGKDITDKEAGLALVNEILESPKANRTFASLAQIDGAVTIRDEGEGVVVQIASGKGKNKQVWTSKELDPATLVVADGAEVLAGDPLTKGRPYGPDRLRIVGRENMLRWIIQELQSVYRGQGVELNDKHFEVIASRMLSKVKVLDSGDTDFLVDSYVDRLSYLAANDHAIASGGKPAEARDTLIGPLQIVRASMRSLGSESFLSLASFMWTTTVLAQAAIEAREDDLVGLKENVIIGKLVPAGTGMKRYRNVDVSYKGTRIADENASDTALAPDVLRDDLQEIESMIPEAEQWDVDPDDFIALMSWNDEDESRIDVSEFVGQTFDPTASDDAATDTVLLGEQQADGASYADIDFSNLDAGDDSADAEIDFSALEALAGTDEEDLSVTEIDPAAQLLSPGHDVCLKDIGVATRWVTKFAAAGISNVADLENKSETDLLELPGIGATAVAEVEKGLVNNGYSPLV